MELWNVVREQACLLIVLQVLLPFAVDPVLGLSLDVSGVEQSGYVAESVYSLLDEVDQSGVAGSDRAVPVDRGWRRCRGQPGCKRWMVVVWGGEDPQPIVSCVK